MVSYAQAQYDQDIDIGEDIEEGVKAGVEEVEKLPIMEFLDAGNIADELPGDAGTTILTDYDTAKGTMSEWLEKYKKALKLAKMQPKESKKTFPFEGASTAMAPFVLESMIDFNARSAPELAYSDKIVKAKVYGGTELPAVTVPDEVPPPPQGLDPRQAQEAQQLFAQKQVERETSQQESAQRDKAQGRIDVEKEDRAERVAEFSNYQLSQLIPTWKRSQDKLLMSLPCVGTMYKKTYYDAGTQEVCSDLCYGDEIVFDQAYPTFEDAPDKYQELPDMTKNEVIEKIRGPEAWEIDEDELSGGDDETYTFLEAYTWFDLDDDGLKEPYCITVWKDKQKAVYARPMFDEVTVVVNDDAQIAKIESVEVFTQFQFIPDPEGGPMGMGWGIILGPTFEQINIAMRSLLDAGTIANLAANSGLIADNTGPGSRGNRVQRGPIEMALGKLTPIPMGGGGNLAQNVVQFPASGPNQTLFALLSYMVESVQRLTDASKQVESNPNEAAALYLARLQQTLKRPNIIIMRVYDCAAKEFEKIFNLNHKHYSDEKYNKVIDAPLEYSMEQDFNPDDCDIRLVADPSQGSDIERMARAEAVLQEAKTQTTPIIDVRRAYADYFEVLGVQDVEGLIPEPQGPDPMQLQIQRQQELDEARQAMEAEFRQRDQKLREQDQQLKQSKQQMEAAKQQLDAFREMKELGLETDAKEADIVLTYTQAYKNLSEVSANMASQVQAIEDQFIDQSEGGLPNGASVTPIPPSNPRANPVMGS